MQEQILILMIPAMTLIFAAGFVAFWWLDRSKIYVLTYAAWFIAVAVGIVMQAWLIPVFGPTEVVVFHCISSSGLIALLWGVAKREGRSVPLKALFGLTAGSGVIAWFATDMGNSAVLIMSQNFNAGLLFAMGAYGKWASGHRHAADRFLLATLTLMAAYSIFRPSITILIQSQMTMAQYQSSVLLTVNLAMTVLLALMIAVSLFACIVSDRFNDEREEALIDPLSGLPNRAAFELRVREMLKLGAHDECPVSLIVGDIDHFKRINDTWGHAVGDKAIAGFSQLIAGKIRNTDVAGRIGGEEFCIAVWNCDAASAARLANRIRVSVADSNRRGEEGGVPAFSASFGVAQVREGEGYEGLFTRADAALYDAKNGGRNRVVTYEDQHNKTGQDFICDPETDTGTDDHVPHDPPVSSGQVVPLVRRKAR